MRPLSPRTGPLLVTAALVAAGLTFAGSAHATTSGTESSTPIVIAGATEASPYPSTLEVSGAGTVIADVNVSLFGVSHTFPGDLTVAVVGPTGQAVVLMSGIGGDTDAVDLNLLFDDAAASAMANPLVSGTFNPTSTRADEFPAPGPGTAYCNPMFTADCLATFNGTDPNGIWRLYVIDTFVALDDGDIGDGWGLAITTVEPPVASIDSGPHMTADSTPTFGFSATEAPNTFECRVTPAGGATPGFEACSSPFTTAALADGDYVVEVKATNAVDSDTAEKSFTVDTATPGNFAAIDIPLAGEASPYPATIEIAESGFITDLDVSLFGLSHAWSTDLDIALMGPTGIAVLLMSDIGSPSAAADPAQIVDLTFDDEAGAAMDLGTNPTSGTYRPSNFDSLDSFPSGGPAGPCDPTVTSDCLSIFDGTDQQGTWKLYVFDDHAGDGGAITDGWSLGLTLDTETSVAIDSGPSGTTVDTTPTFEFSSPEMVGFGCRIFAQGSTPGAFAECSGPDESHTAAAPLPFAAYTFEVQATDGASNTATEARNFTVIEEPTCTTAKADKAEAQAALVTTKAGLAKFKKKLKKAKKQLKKAKASGNASKIKKFNKQVKKYKKKVKKAKAKVKSATASLAAANSAIASTC